MKNISSRNTFIYKYVVPGVALGFAFLGLVDGLFDPIEGDPGFNFQTLIFSFAFIVLYRFFKRTFFSLADQVFLDKEALVVREKKKTEKILFDKIISVAADSNNGLRTTVTYQSLEAVPKEFSFLPDSVDSVMNLRELVSEKSMGSE